MESLSKSPTQLPKAPSTVALWKLRFAVLGLLSLAASCQSRPQTQIKKPTKSLKTTLEQEKTKPTDTKICYKNGIKPKQYPPADISHPPSSDSGLDEFIYEQYASGQLMPVFSFETVENDPEDPIVTRTQLEEIYEKSCRDERGRKLKIRPNVPETIEIVTSKYEGHSTSTPIIQVGHTCNLITVDSNKKEIGVEGYFNPGKIVMKGPLRSDLSLRDIRGTKWHEATHADNHLRFKENHNDLTEFRADQVFSASELAMMNFPVCSPVSMKRLGEKSAQVIEMHSFGNATYLDEAEYAWAIAGMNRIDSFLKHNKKPVTKNNYKEFNPYHLMSRFSEWSDEVWAEEAALYAFSESSYGVWSFAGNMAHMSWSKSVFEATAKGKLFVILSEVPFVIDILGVNYFPIEEYNDNADLIISMPRLLRQRHFADFKLNREGMERYLDGIDFLKSLSFSALYNSNIKNTTNLTDMIMSIDDENADGMTFGRFKNINPLGLLGANTDILDESALKAVFDEAIRKNPEMIAYIPRSIRKIYWPDKQLDKAMALRLVWECFYDASLTRHISNNTDLFDKEVLEEFLGAKLFAITYIQTKQFNREDIEPEIVLFIAKEHPLALLNYGEELIEDYSGNKRKLFRYLRRGVRREFRGKTIAHKFDNLFERAEQVESFQNEQGYKEGPQRKIDLINALLKHKLLPKSHRKRMVELKDKMDAEFKKGDE